MNSAGLICVTVGVGGSVFLAVALAPCGRFCSPPVKATLTEGDLAPLLMAVAPPDTPVEPGNALAVWVPNRFRIPVLPVTNPGFLAAAIYSTNSVTVNSGPLFDLPSPRVYKAVPYSMLVLVPGPLLDDGMVKPPPPTNRMPILRPKLKLVPRN